MESFRTFFDRINRIEPEFGLPGHFSTGIYYDIFEEGLIHSYDIEKVKQKIFTMDNFVEIYAEDPNSFLVIFDILDKEFENQIELSNNTLKVYGYFVSKMNGRIPNKGISFTIEKKIPDKVDPSTNSIEKYYHITHSKYIDKIISSGISPRESSTIFKHPGDRVYLIQTSNENTLSILAKALFNSKLKTLGMKYAKTNSNEDSNRFLSFANGKMMGVEVDVNGLELYYDPMVDRNDNIYRAVFTNDFISPKRLKEPFEITFIQ